MTNYELLQQFTPEQMAEFLAMERFNLLKPIFELAGFAIHPQIVSIILLNWLNSEVDENEQREAD